MSTKTHARLTPAERLARGLKYSAVGPADVTRGAVGLGAQSVHSAGAALRRHYREGRLRSQVAAAQDAIAAELAAAQTVVANLPQVLQDARRPKRRPRPWVLAVAAAAVLAGGAVAFSLVRRSSRSRSEYSTLEPSVDVTPRP
jgi:cell wall synthesis protein CwsA